jgi:hypothetical protein
LNKITPPKQSNTFFTTKLSCATFSSQDRDIFFTEDVLEVLKAGQVKGPYCDRLWTNEELKTRKEKEKQGESWRPSGMTVYLNGKGGKPTEKKSAAGQRWFKEYLKSNAKKKPAAVDFAAVEKKRKVKLPQAYQDFIATVGPKSFKDVLETEGFVAKILPPEKMNFRDYRLGKWEDTDEEAAEVDGVMFATTDHGDCFVFDVSGKGSDYPVYRYDHETNAMEPWADNFADSIERFVKQN